MSKRVQLIYSAKDKNNIIDYAVNVTKDLQTQVEWTTVLNSVDPLELDFSTITSVYSCCVAATADVTVELYTGSTNYAAFDGSMLIFAPSAAARAQFDHLRVTSSLDDLEVKVSVFGE